MMHDAAASMPVTVRLPFQSVLMSQCSSKFKLPAVPLYYSASSL